MKRKRYSPEQIIRKVDSPRSSALARIGMLALAAVAGAVTVRADMPFVEIDPETTTAFRLRGTGESFVAVGVNYFDHETGWAPKLWQKFDPQRVRQHLGMLHEQGFNTIRVFLSHSSFHQEPGQVHPDGEAKFRQLVAMCRELGLYIIISGPDHWEGTPEWRRGDPFADEAILSAEEAWWKAFAAKFRDEPAILAWGLINEPSVRWDTPAMRVRWNEWLEKEYGAAEKIADAWERPIEEVGGIGDIDVPPAQPARNDQRLYDYQRFREHIGDAWTRRHVRAIRSAAPNHLVTIGHIQWSVPINLPSVQHYAGFEQRANAAHLDFTTVHFYPLDSPRPCDAPEGFEVNAAYLEALLYLADTGKPLMIGEFNWYGGGGLGPSGPWGLPPQPPEHQAEWCARLLDISRGRISGWLNWAFADTPTSGDITRWSGLWTADLEMKPWGRVFGAFAREITAKPDAPRPWPDHLTGFDFDRRALLTDPEAGAEHRRRLRTLRER